MPWLTFCAMFLLYMYNLPVMFAFVWDGEGYGTGAGVFEPRFALRRADRRMTGKAKHINYEKLSKKALKFVPIRAAAGVGARAMTRVRLRRLHVFLEIGAGDAALTARIVGAIYALTCALGRARGEVRVTPDFSGRALRGRAEVVFSLRPGDMARAAWGYLSSRIDK